MTLLRRAIAGPGAWLVAFAASASCLRFVADKQSPAAGAATDGGVPFDSGPHEDGTPPGDCHPLSFPFNATEAYQGEGSCMDASCSSNGSGVELKFCIDKADGGDWSWATCAFSRGQDLNAFDVDVPGGNSGMVEVRVCVVGDPPAGGSNLWYGQHPRRKRLPLFRDRIWKTGEPVTANDCRTLFFGPAEAIYPRFTDPDGGAPEFPGEGCGQVDRCGAGGPVCAPAGGFEAELSVAAEHATQRTQGTLRIEWVRYYPASCQCQSDDGCEPGSGCTKSQGADGGCAPPGGPGVCTECVGVGEPCTVSTVGGSRSCNSMFVCLDGKLTCPCAP